MRDLTVAELRDLLDALPDDMPIRVAEQPSYPLALAIEPRIRRYQGAAYLLAPEHPYNVNPYLPKRLFDDDDDDEDGELSCDECGGPTSYVTDDDERMPACTRCAAAAGVEIISQYAPR